MRIAGRGTAPVARRRAAARALTDARVGAARRLHAPTRRLALAGGLLLIAFAALLIAPLSIPANPRLLPEPDPLVTILGAGWLGVARYVLPVLLVFGLYLCALLAARRARGRAATVIVLAVTALLLLALLTLNYVTAGDVLHNVADARTLWLHGKDPAIVPPSTFSADPIAAVVPAWRSTPSAYGPVWYALSGLPLPFAGNGVWANVIGQKLLVGVFLFGAVVLSMKLAARAGAKPLVAGVLVGWNPLLLWEAAGNGHNDAVMVFFALAALLAATYRRWWLAVFPLLALAIASKAVLAVLGPPLLLWLLLQPGAPHRRILVSLLLGGATLAACYAPLWEGQATIVALSRESGHVSSSPGSLVHTLIWEATNWDGVRILDEMRLVVWPLFLTLYGLILWRTRGESVEALLRSCFWCMFLLLTLALWWFMPWYLTWLVPLAAALGTRARATAIAFSAGALLLYAPHMWLMNAQPVPLDAVIVAVCFVPPLVVALVPLPRRAAPTEAALPAAAD